MDLLKVIKASWGWCGLEPEEILRLNRFGNVLLRDKAGAYWRICPEGLTCDRIATLHAGYEVLLQTPEFIEDWNMTNLVEQASEVVGELTEGTCYCFKLPPCFPETSYASDNMTSAPVDQVIGAAGEIARQIRNLPDGSQFRLTVVP